MEQEKIRETLKELADQNYKEFQAGLCPGVSDILGVRVPVLRNFAKQISKQDWRTYLDTAWDEYYEERMLQGMVLGLAKMEIEEFKKRLITFIPKIDNWAICDVTVGGFKITKKYLEEMWQFIQPYLKSDKEFEVRFAVVMMMDYYITDDFIEKVLTHLETIKQGEYYVQMAVAWAISVAFVKYQKQTMELLKRNHLDEFTYQKALQKIIESYRVDEEMKQTIRQMKKGK